MPAHEVVSRLQLLSSAPKQDRVSLVNELHSDLSALESGELGELLSLCENALQPKSAARAATRFLLKACRGREDFSLERLLRCGVSLPTVLQLARQTPLSDVPPSSALADELLCLVLSWEPVQDGAGGGPQPLQTILGAVRHLGLLEHLHAEAAEAVLRHAVDLEHSAGDGAKRFTVRALAEIGDVLPEWRPLVLQVFLAPDLAHAVVPSEIVRVAQDWGAHEDPAVFSRLRQLLEDREASARRDSGPNAEDAEGCTSSAVAGADLPRLALVAERVVLVDGPETESIMSAATDAALAAAAEGRTLLVGLDAEWEDPRPLSLLQLAVGIQGAEADADDPEVQVFLVDMLAAPSQATLECCRRLLRGTPQGRHEVLAFAPREDRRRLAVAGILPELTERSPSGDDAATRVDAAAGLGWIDLQSVVWGHGSQPSLRTVVKKALGASMDKRLQKSNWDRRPLSQEQLDYAALDASVLLRLRKCWRSLQQANAAAESDGRSAGGSPLAKEILTYDEEKARWQRWRRALASSAEAAAGEADQDKKSINGDLRFAVVTALTKLARKMRGLGLDSVILGESSKASHQAFRAAAAEGRILLTRSRKMKLPAAALEQTYVLRSESTDEQLREVIDVFGVEVHADCLCGRCVQCNAWDWRFASRADLQGNPQVGEKTLQSYDEFWVCGGCGKVFWEGSMFEKAVGHFRTFMPDAEGAGAPAVSESPEGGAVPAEASAADDDKLTKYHEMEASGCSSQQIRVRMLRDGVLTPGAPAPPAAQGQEAPEQACSRAATASLFQQIFAEGVAAGLDANEAASAALRAAAGVPRGC